MPLVRVSMVEGRTAAQKKAAAEAITRTMVEHCACDPAHVYVIFDDVPRHRLDGRRRDRGRTPARAW
jgi:4-oxalocrotonate tautomerase